jgi:acyl-CoA thioester hydrolase
MAMKHRTAIQIRFKDVDALGHVNNANHVTYFEYARIRFFDELIGGDIDWDNEGMILAHQQVSYKKPIYLKDEISVLTWFVKSGTTSFELGYDIVRKEKDGSETVCATGSSVQVCYNYKTQMPVPIPERWVKKMLA